MAGMNAAPMRIGSRRNVRQPDRVRAKKIAGRRADEKAIQPSQAFSVSRDVASNPCSRHSQETFQGAARGIIRPCDHAAVVDGEGLRLAAVWHIETHEPGFGRAHETMLEIIAVAVAAGDLAVVIDANRLGRNRSLDGEGLTDIAYPSGPAFAIIRCCLVRVYSGEQQRLGQSQR